MYFSKVSKGISQPPRY